MSRRRQRRKHRSNHSQYVSPTCPSLQLFVPLTPTLRSSHFRSLPLTLLQSFPRTALQITLQCVDHTCGAVRSFTLVPHSALILLPPSLTFGLIIRMSGPITSSMMVAMARRIHIGIGRCGSLFSGNPNILRNRAEWAQNG